MSEQQDEAGSEAERADWQDALDDVTRVHGGARAAALLAGLERHLMRRGVALPDTVLNTPYRNTISLADEPQYPGDIELEQRIENILRWNAVAIVQKAEDSGAGVGGHIATYLSAATMMEVGFNHVFRGPDAEGGGDLVTFQAHSAPGVYARAFLEGRLSEAQLRNFRRELGVGGGLSSYPHPRRMPDFWPLPCASMGLSTPTSIYLARLSRYLEHRHLKSPGEGKVWTFIGDGEADEPEVLGTINIAARERLDNLVLVINCNLQRLDGPVRGNGKIIQELERAFRGAGWHVLKVIWGGGWDPILARDTQGILQQRMDEALDGDYQYYTVSGGDTVREHWVEKTPALRELMKTLSNEEIRTIRRGGQDHRKVYAAYHAARAVRGQPVVILAKTVKGDGLGATAEGRNTVHQKKKLTRDERRELAERLGIPLPRDAVDRADFYLPDADAPEMAYLRARRASLGGSLPARRVRVERVAADSDTFAPFLQAHERPASTTQIMVRMLSRLLRDKRIGRYIVPIVPDEARTFGMDGLFPQAGIYSPEGQRYIPVDAGSIAPYREATDGQILQEGICETGAMASFLAAGTAYANHGLPMIPFYIFYSIFGAQRVGDMIWACGDAMAKGFLLGGTSGRTTLNGEGVQHQDGHSQLLASTVPTLACYDPSFAYELAVIVREGIVRMYERQEDVFYYLTITNQAHSHPAMPAGVTDEQILRGLYCFRRGSGDGRPLAHLLGSGAIMQEVLEAVSLLDAFGVDADVWSVPSYVTLAREAEAVARRNLLWPEREPEVSWVEKTLRPERGVFVAASDYMRALPARIAHAFPGPLAILGTDGFGLSESRPRLRDHFEVSARWIAFAALSLLRRQQAWRGDLDAAAGQLGVDRAQADAAVG